MSSEWATLSQINFLIHRRLTAYLENAVTVLDESPEAHHSVRHEIQAAQGVYNAWTNLIRFKAGESPAITGSQQISSCELLQWIAAELNISRVPDCDEEEVLRGNPETVKEAVIALRSCTQTLGPRPQIHVQRHDRGIWLRMRYGSTGNSPATLDALMLSLQDNWRLETAAFELSCAYDFLKMNGLDLFYTQPDGFCELAFFLPLVHMRGQRGSAKEQAKSLLDGFNATDTYEVITGHEEVSLADAETPVSARQSPQNSQRSDL